MSLREVIARRMFVLWWNDSGNLSGARAWKGLDNLTERKDWLSLADEVIRIAEWARRGDPGMKFTAEGPSIVIKWPPLTLPPDGWAIDTREPREPK